jgi:L-ascorbate metabolism protein UlaG (beta-lactamase superfamily)
MARFDDLATQPRRGPADILRWKLGRSREARPADAAALEKVRPGVRDPAAAAMALARPEAAMTWLGHASFALRLAGKLVLTDPVLCARIQRVVRRLTPPGVAVDALPPVDVVTVSHDHMDHMDFWTLARLPDAALYVVPLGNGERLRALGKARVVELDWWQSHREGALEITLVPARHWSMRMPWTRNETLWGGFVYRGPEGIAYHSGDSAFGPHYAEIGARVPGIDWAMLPIGAYAPRWFMEPQHQDPEEAARGWQALGARTFVAMHWGTFRLTDEPIGEPPVRLRAFWGTQGLPPERLWIPDIGERRVLSSGA